VKEEEEQQEEEEQEPSGATCSERHRRPPLNTAKYPAHHPHETLRTFSSLVLHLQHPPDRPAPTAARSFRKNSSTARLSPVPPRAA